MGDSNGWVNMSPVFFSTTAPSDKLICINYYRPQPKGTKQAFHSVKCLIQCIHPSEIVKAATKYHHMHTCDWQLACLPNQTFRWFYLNILLQNANIATAMSQTTGFRMAVQRPMGSLIIHSLWFEHVCPHIVHMVKIDHWESSFRNEPELISKIKITQ